MSGDDVERRWYDSRDVLCRAMILSHNGMLCVDILVTSLHHGIRAQYFLILQYTHRV